MEFLFQKIDKKEKAQTIKNITELLEEKEKDQAIKEKLGILNYCFRKEINSVIFEYSSQPEIENFMKCINKQLTTKLLIIEYSKKNLSQIEGNHSQKEKFIDSFMKIKPLFDIKCKFNHK